MAKQFINKDIFESMIDVGSGFFLAIIIVFNIHKDTINFVSLQT